MKVLGLALQEIADHPGVSPETVCWWLEEQTLSTHKIGQPWKIQMQNLIDEGVVP